MAIRDNIGRGLARANLAVARRIGISGLFSHASAAEVTLYANVLKDAIEQIETSAGLVEKRVLTLQIPVQTGFAYSSNEAEPISPGDRFTFNSREWFALQPIDKDATGRNYVVRFVEDKPSTLG
jgi:hypothetical protein